MEALQWIVENYKLLLGIVAALVTVASLVTSLTSSPKDDKIVSKIRKFLGRLGVMKFGGGAKLPGQDPENKD